MQQTYMLRDGCQVCRHVFVYTDYDCGPFFYCTLDTPPRPLCMSVGMNECPEPFEDNKLQLGGFRKWHEWSEGREVNPGAICGEYGRGIKDEDKSLDS